jgi:hypothetical protein
VLSLSFDMQRVKVRTHLLMAAKSSQRDYSPLAE